MSDVVTISSGVHVGTRVRGERMNQGWFGASPSTLFTSIELDLADVQGLESIVNTPEYDAPVSLRFAGSGLRDALPLLRGVEARGLLNGQPFTGLSGWRDALAKSGQLVNLSLYLYKDTTARSGFGVLTDVQANVEFGARNWSVTARFWPCDALNYVGTLSWFVTPAGYALLPEAT